MPEAARNYSITELEMCSLAINIASFAHLLKRVDFDAIVDHLAITHVMKSKMEPATNRIKRLLEILSSYSFNLYYIKGKDMILSNFLSRQIKDDSNLHEIIPISFTIQEILQESYHNMVTDAYKVQMRAQAKSQANAPTTVNASPAVQKATIKTINLPSKKEKGKDIEMPPSNAVQQPPRGFVLPPGSVLHSTVIPPSIRPPLKPPNVDKTTESRDPEPDLNIGIEENSPHQEGIITETYVSLD